jgi:hypothetical protein
LSDAHVSPLGWQPGSALHTLTPAAVAVQRPLQQSAPRPHVSPATRQPGSRAQRRVLSGRSAHAPPQQSLSTAQGSPAARHAVPGAMHLPAAQLAEQQSRLSAHDAPVPAHTGTPHRPPSSQPSEQQAPARAHDWPLDQQPAGGRQASAPLGPSPQTSAQQSVGRAHGSPSRAQAAAAPHRPRTQLPEQQPALDEQASPFGVHASTRVACTSSRSRTHAPRSSAASSHGGTGMCTFTRPA